MLEKELAALTKIKNALKGLSGAERVRVLRLITESVAEESEYVEDEDGEGEAAH